MTADFIISQLLFLDAEDPKKDIKLFINSPGGSVTAGMSTNFFSVLLFLLLNYILLSMCFYSLEPTSTLSANIA